MIVGVKLFGRVASRIRSQHLSSPVIGLSSRLGISTVLATVLLVVIVVSGSALIYVILTNPSPPAYP